MSSTHIYPPPPFVDFDFGWHSLHLDWPTCSLILSPFELRGEKGPSTHCVCICVKGAQKQTRGNSVFVHLPSIQLYVHGYPWTGHYGSVTSLHGKAGACTQYVYQALTLPQFKGLGTRRLILLYMLYTCIMHQHTNHPMTFTYSAV